MEISKQFTIFALPSDPVHCTVVDDSLGPRDGGPGGCVLVLSGSKSTATYELRAADGLTQPVTGQVFEGVPGEPFPFSVLIGTLSIIPGNPIRIDLSSADDLEIRPSTEVFPHCLTQNVPSNGHLTARCVNAATGEAVTGCQIGLTVSAVAGSGGHLHFHAGRPGGNLNPVSGVTDSNGVLPFDYTAPEVSGTMLLTATGTDPQGRAMSPVTARVHVHVDEPLFPISAAVIPLPLPDVRWNIAPSVGHENLNDFLTFHANQRFIQTPIVFTLILAALEDVPHDQIPGLTATSLSLPDGGLFDVDTAQAPLGTHAWHPPHCGHRAGIHGDVRTGGSVAAYLSELRLAIKHSCLLEDLDDLTKQSCLRISQEADHWHVISPN